MKIICPKCNTVYNVPSDKMPKTKVMTACKKCGEHIVIEPGLATPPEPLADPPTSPASYPSSTTAERTREKASLALFVDYPELKVLSSDKFNLEEILSPNKTGGYKSR
jgi:predicted Zn finger-like uncharacterized protein